MKTFSVHQLTLPDEGKGFALNISSVVKMATNPDPDMARLMLESPGNNLYAKYTLVGVVSVEEDQGPEDVFNIAQNDTISWLDKLELTSFVASRSARSVSVGDVIFDYRSLDNYLVMPVGMLNIGKVRVVQ